MRRAVLLLVLILLVPPIAVVGADGIVGTDADARVHGDGPLDDILYWADQNKRCGLSRDKLAALMIAPTYPETGAPATAAPSPMTLSRWDNQTALYAFGNPSGYRNAFWHPGVGQFAFDSAGLGAPYTAAQRIDTGVIAARTAEVMADRWCTNPSKSYVWQPWFGCNGGTCTDIFNQIYQNGRLVNVSRDLTVGSRGGMGTRTCRLMGNLDTFPCNYVNAASAQGYRGFANPVFGPSPVSAPFYVYAQGGKEWRHWLRADTGYGVDISASRVLGVNARNGLDWERYSDLCDLSTGRGQCSYAEFNYGQERDWPLPGDWDGNGVDTAGVRRGTSFFLRNHNSAGPAHIVIKSYGWDSDLPLAGDWDGDGDETIGVRRGSRFMLRNSNSSGAANVIVDSYGWDTDIPLVGDWDGDGDDTVGVRRGSTFYLRNSNTPGPADIVINSYGWATDWPVVGDWDGDGDDTVGVVRGGVFYLRNSNTGGAANRLAAYGPTGAIPMSGIWKADTGGIGTVNGVRWREMLL